MEYWNRFDVVDGKFKPLILSDEQIQVLLTGKFGDGCFVTTSHSIYYSACTLYQEYNDFKASLLGDLLGKQHRVFNNGYKEGYIYRLYTHADPRIALICEESIEESFNRMNELGLALWIYDDGSMHKDKEFYQINTQKYPKEILEEVFIPGLKNKFGITAKTTIERKKDGREFWYLCISKYEGSDIISSALSKYPMTCYAYKMWKPETVQKWNIFKEKVAQERLDIGSLSYRTVGAMFRKILI